MVLSYSILREIYKLVFYSSLKTFLWKQNVKCSTVTKWLYYCSNMGEIMVGEKEESKGSRGEYLY